MWLRRIGVPALWPSRVKVVFLAVFKSTVIITVLQYLTTANISYLDLKRPAAVGIQCHLPTVFCINAEDPVKCIMDLDQEQWMYDLDLRQPCPFTPVAQQHQTCTNVSMPLEQALDHLSLRTSAGGINPLRAWSLVFIVLVVLETVLIMVHDLILIHEPRRFQAPGYNPRNDKKKILTLYDMKSETPFFWRCIGFLCGNQRSHNITRWKSEAEVRRQRMPAKTCWIVIMRPSIWFLRSAAFIVVTLPYTLILFCLYPRRMSRIAVFAANILCMICSLSFIIFGCVQSWFRQVPYVLLWNAQTANGGNCVCSCDFPFKHAVTLRFIVLGATVLLNSTNIAMLTLKGLRHAHWANMISVLYPVPIGTFPVEWERPTKTGGGPARWRNEGEPVQGEPAFDPFCLMDEQPESGRTRPSIAPMKLMLNEGDGQLRASSADRRWERLNSSDGEGVDVGCCGFPAPKVTIAGDVSAATTSRLADRVFGEDSSSEEDVARAVSFTVTTPLARSGDFLGEDSSSDKEAERAKHDR